MLLTPKHLAHFAFGSRTLRKGDHRTIYENSGGQQNFFHALETPIIGSLHLIRYTYTGVFCVVRLVSDVFAPRVWIVIGHHSHSVRRQHLSTRYRIDKQTIDDEIIKPKSQKIPKRIHMTSYTTIENVVFPSMFDHSFQVRIPIKNGTIQFR